MNEVVIHGISVNGEGVGRLADGRVVFVEGALPGDQVRVRLAERRKKVQHAELLQVLVPSAERVSSRCPIERCGGCPMRQVSADLQGRLKRQAVVETLRRLAGLEVEVLVGPLLRAGEAWGYRHRVRLHARFIENQWRLGYFARRSHALMPLVRCPVVWPEVEQLGLALESGLAPLSEGLGLDEVEIAFSRRDRRGAARLRLQGPLAPLRQSLGWLEHSGLGGVHALGSDGQWRHGNLELHYDHRRADAFDLRFEPGLFTQANPEANDVLVDLVVAAVRPHTGPTVLELHAGIGNFSLPLARAGARVVAFEVDRRASIVCQRNGGAPGLDLEVHCRPDTAALPRLAAAEVVLLDPPRAGARAVAQHLARHGRGRVVYVSCDVGTFARDAALLCRGGYELHALHAVDLFPQTPHVEVVGVFDRAA